MCGAKVRDATKWAAYLNDSLRHVKNSEVVFNQHHWPVWGAANIQDFIVKQRDTYQFIHDQTVRQMNAGLNAAEIAENLRLPPSLDEHLSVRGYYGTVRHNVKAVYQNYMGWFDAHPSNLDPLPALQASEKYVQLMGGVDKVVTAAQEAMAKTDYRWAAELLKHAVYVAPKHEKAKEMLAQSFEKLGFAAESSAWRNFYLTGALELRQGTPEKGIAARVNHGIDGRAAAHHFTAWLKSFATVEASLWNGVEAPAVEVQRSGGCKSQGRTNKH